MRWFSRKKNNIIISFAGASVPAIKQGTLGKKKAGQKAKERNHKIKENRKWITRHVAVEESGAACAEIAVFTMSMLELSCYRVVLKNTSLVLTAASDTEW